MPRSKGAGWPAEAGRKERKMSRPLIHTPEGVRDIYGTEYRRKLIVEDRLHQVLYCFRKLHPILDPLLQGCIPNTKIHGSLWNSAVPFSP